MENYYVSSSSKHVKEGKQRRNWYVASHKKSQHKKNPLFSWWNDKKKFGVEFNFSFCSKWRILDTLEITQWKLIATFRQEGKRGGQWGCEEDIRILVPPLTTPQAWTDMGGHDPSPDHGPHLLAPLSPPPLQTPDFACQSPHTLGHMQRDLVTLCSNRQTYIQVATYSSGPEEQQSTGPGLPLIGISNAASRDICQLFLLGSRPHAHLVGKPHLSTSSSHRSGAKPEM